MSSSNGPFSYFPNALSNGSAAPVGLSGGSPTPDDHKVMVNATDTTPDYLDAKVVAGANITLDVLNPAGNAELEISAHDPQVKVNAADTTPDYLYPKLTAGPGISMSVLNPGANSSIEVSSTLDPDKVKVSAVDVLAEYLASKLTAGAGVTLTVLNPGATESIEISAAMGPISGPFGQQIYEYATANGSSPIWQTGSAGSAVGTRGWAFIPNATATYSRMRIAVRQLGGSNLRLGIYNSAGNRLAQTARFSPVSNSIITASLLAPVTLLGGAVYYMAYWSDDSTANITYPVITGRDSSTTSPLLQVSDPNEMPIVIGSGLATTSMRNWLMVSE